MEKVKGIYIDKRVDNVMVQAMRIKRSQRYLALPYVRQTRTYQRAVARLVFIDLLKALTQLLFNRHYKFIGVK